MRITEFSVTEEAFDPALNPIRAKVSLGLRVLIVDDLGFAHTRRQRSSWPTCARKEQLAGKRAAGALEALGIGGIR